MYTKPPHFDVAFANIVAHSTITIHLWPILMEALDSFLDRLEQVVDPIKKQNQHLHVIAKWANEVLRPTLASVVERMEYPNSDANTNTPTQVAAILQPGGTPPSQPQTPKALTAVGASPTLSGSSSAHSQTLDATAVASSNFASPSSFRLGATPPSSQPQTPITAVGSTSASSNSPYTSSQSITDLLATSHSDMLAPKADPTSQQNLGLGAPSVGRGRGRVAPRPSVRVASVDMSLINGAFTSNKKGNNIEGREPDNKNEKEFELPKITALA
ncbi:hypothetical protein E1B28_005110 [Marasmius oreades]|uniref:Uncharacterized protein n=1 Tax=Marasmius oreades TaxID=181124 RepID=A0A9P7UZY2_9AGAR|nr:uncharacterized protein E1B28_005110 [Marasmius oreades]KAG7097791.1 hypothetical protein E1B28_005110 [Marasmius oreades]